jgi:hypothetical protein
MWDDQTHLHNLLRHLELVRQASELLGRRLIRDGEPELGIGLIARGRAHDQSKFFGIEYKYLHRGPMVDPVDLHNAIDVHCSDNDHHPEFWESVELMPDVCLAEMVCDWYARGQEFGTDVRGWIEVEASKRYKISKAGPAWTTIQRFLDLLLEPSFVHKGS